MKKCLWVVLVCVLLTASHVRTQDIPGAVQKLKDAILLLGGTTVEPMTVLVTVANAQTTIDSAPAGSVLLLEPGTMYPPLVLSGDAQGKVIASAGTFPAGRLDPMTAPPMAKIPHLQITGTHWTVRAVEVYSANTSLGVESVSCDRTSSQTLLDRMYIHSSLGSFVRRGVVLNSGSASLVDNYIGGYGTNGVETQAVGGWDGPGPYTIVNNYLEAATENLMFGGGDPSTQGLIPSDIYIAKNTLNKPESWRGQALNVKNILELKNAQRVVIEDNELSGSWMQAQSGFAFTLTVRNQNGGCPWCTVQHVMIRRNRVTRAGAAVQILAHDAEPNGTPRPSVLMDDVTFVDNVFNLSPQPGDAKAGWQIQFGPTHLTIDHNVLTSAGSIPLGSFLDFSWATLTGFTFIRNEVYEGQYGIHSAEYVLGTSTLSGYSPQGYTWVGPSGEPNIVHRCHDTVGDGCRTIAYPAGTTLVP